MPLLQYNCHFTKILGLLLNDLGLANMFVKRVLDLQAELLFAGWIPLDLPQRAEPFLPTIRLTAQI